MSARPRTPALIGREQALRDLDDALATVAGTPAHGTLLLVAGEVGIGKTRLLEELAARAAHATVVRAGCVEHASYAPWTEAMWWLSAPWPSTDALDDESGRHHLFEAVVDVLTRVAARSRLVLVIDDAHWIDPASAELLRYVAASLARIPMLLVVAYRTEDAGAQLELLAHLGRLAHSRITLDRLGDDATREMARVLLGDEAAPADIDRIARAADGNPLFVEELVAARDRTRVPETVRDLMLVRFRALDDDARQLVRTAAIVGVRAPRAWLVGASGLGDTRSRSAARGAVEAGILVASPDRDAYEFRHPLLRQAVLDDVLPDERVALHRSAAEALEAIPDVAAGIARVPELARHWDAAGDAARALPWLVASARDAQASYASDAAFAAYERALVWWSAVPDAEQLAGVDHAALLLEAADAAGIAGHIDRAADLARQALDESNALDAPRALDAAGRVYPLLWAADRAPELFEYATTLVPMLDDVDAPTRARFLVSRVEHLVGYATPPEIREPAQRMIAALADVDDPVLAARAHVVHAWCCEAFGEFDEAEREYARAADIARDAGANAMLALALYNHAAFKTSVPDLAGCVALLDAVDDLVERFGLRRYLVPARRLRALASSLRGDLGDARNAIASLDELVAQGFDAWARAFGRALIDLFAGDVDLVLHTLDAGSVGVAMPKDSELVIEIAILRAQALAWTGDLEAARRAVDEGQAAVDMHRETHLHGWLAMVGARIEADGAQSDSLADIERSSARASGIAARWHDAVGELQRSSALVDAYTVAIAAEQARLRGEQVAERNQRAADAFDAISMPYYATYFRWREAEARLADHERRTATEVLKRARTDARLHGFGGLDRAIAALARTHQLRVGPGRTTVDGKEPLSRRELEVLRLMVGGRSNPEIAEQLFISRRTAAAHVSSILRKLGASSRVEAVSEAYRRGLV